MMPTSLAKYILCKILKCLILCWERISFHRQRSSRAIWAALHSPNCGGARCHRGPKIPVSHHLAPQIKLRSPKLEYEAREISEVKGPFERKVHCSCFGPLWKQGIFTLPLLLGALWKQSSPLIHCSYCWAPFESQVGYFAHYSCKGGPEASASLAFP